MIKFDQLQIILITVIWILNLIKSKKVYLKKRRKLNPSEGPAKYSWIFVQFDKYRSTCWMNPNFIII